MHVLVGACTESDPITCSAQGASSKLSATHWWGCCKWSPGWHGSTGSTFRPRWTTRFPRYSMAFRVCKSMPASQRSKIVKTKCEDYEYKFVCSQNQAPRLIPPKITNVQSSIGRRSVSDGVKDLQSNSPFFGLLARIHGLKATASARFSFAELLPGHGVEGHNVRLRVALRLFKGFRSGRGGHTWRFYGGLVASNFLNPVSDLGSSFLSSPAGVFSLWFWDHLAVLAIAVQLSNTPAISANMVMFIHVHIPMRSALQTSQPPWPTELRGCVCRFHCWAHVHPRS